MFGIGRLGLAIIHVVAVLFLSSELGMLALFDLPTMGLMWLVGSFVGGVDDLANCLDPVFVLAAVSAWAVIGGLLGFLGRLAGRKRPPSTNS